MKRLRLICMCALALGLPVALAQAGHPDDDARGDAHMHEARVGPEPKTYPYSPALPARDASAPPMGTPAQTDGANARYALANGCYALRSQALGQHVVKTDGGYAATAGAPAAAEPFRMQATRLGSYLFYSPARQFMAGSTGPLANGAVVTDATASPAADWRVDDAGSAFKIVLPSAGKALATGEGGKLVLTDPAGAGLFTFVQATGCPGFPEVETSATGTPGAGPTPYGETRGYIDAHMHMMAFEFLGGRAHCARPWHPYGVEYALVDCPDHYPNGAGGVLETALNEGQATHDPVGWPTFKDWPRPQSLTHEQSYYKWLERSWMGGQRLFVNLLVENRVLCELYPLKQNNCDEMESVRLQAKRIRELEDYIDAQNGGPGKGWFRIVTDPFQARRVINQGKMAIVLGIEVSEPFGCRVYNDEPQCDARQIDAGLDEMYKLGVRQMELVNKFDNALAGVAGDAGQTGLVVNQGNKLSTGNYWKMQACDGPPDEADKESPGVYDHDHNDLGSNILEAFLPPGAAPVYPRGAQCNSRGLTVLGEHLIRRMIERGMIVDPDHLSALSRKQVLSLLEAARHSGAISSHTWSSPDATPRIYQLGGIVTPYAGNSKSFVEAWKNTKAEADPRFYFGFGYGADMNGLGSQGDPRNGPNPVRYPFKSFDGEVTLERGRSGSRIWDINTDGVANYGLYPDWIEDLRMQAGDEIVEDMARGSEAYLQMWERAEGVRAAFKCRPSRGRMTGAGLSRVRLGLDPVEMLRAAGQPAQRTGRVYRWCVRGERAKTSKVVTVFDKRQRATLVASTGIGHRGRTLGLVKGKRAARIRRAVRRLGKGLMIRKARGGKSFVYGVRAKRVRYVAVVPRSVARKRPQLRAYLRLAGLR